jgi:hypothetical protein
VCKAIEPIIGRELLFDRASGMQIREFGAIPSSIGMQEM